ncbi:T6SS phospholipase effector Tle1-like catalytic domain-containing protein [Pseudomonas sp. NPDC096917]|uniref:T6SS phospholipase effector Tle1-like catalytic domain-containing protein n=1 Tax=Pseudomonas sp. NPDC096917 TaxID=3364483 RepID=UPI00383B41B0
MANKNVPTQIWRHVGGEGGYTYLDDMTAKELADQEAEHRRYERIAAADAASYQRGFEYYEQQQREERARKFDLSLRIGVFFDGTGNNASNTFDGMRCGAHHPVRAEDLDGSCKEYMADPESSYGNDLSNVAKLSRLYTSDDELKGSGKSRSLQRSFYMDGIGTVRGEKDSRFGSGTGRGETGVEERVGKMFQELLKWMQGLSELHLDAEISSVTFDVFGFSRGAAAARHFANHVTSGTRGYWRELIDRSALKLSPSFAPYKDVQLGFVGLFDTVASIVGWDNFGNLSSRHIPNLQLYLNRNVIGNVVQLAARDEKRFNFALSRVSPDHLEITLPGVHSDIGGGYRALMQEALMVTPLQSLDVALDQDVTATSIYRDAIDAKAQWIAEGWPADALHIVTPEAEQLPPDSEDRLAAPRKRVYAGLQIRREVRGELSRVYCRVMHALARAKKVPFEDIPEKTEFQIPEELQPLCNRFVAGDYSIPPVEERLLRRHYIHTSAHWNHPKAKARGQAIKLLYLHSPMEDGIRVRHPHVSTGSAL